MVLEERGSGGWGRPRVGVRYAGEAQASVRGGLAEPLLPGRPLPCGCEGVLQPHACLGEWADGFAGSRFQLCCRAEGSHSHLDLKELGPP